MYNVSLKFRVAPSVRPRRKSHVLAMFQHPSETLDDVRLRCPDDLAPIVDAIHVSAMAPAASMVTYLPAV